MKYEKMYYSFIGCLAAGTIIQNNMNLSWMYVLIITVGLWAVCVGFQYSSAQREHKEKIQQDEHKFNKQREEFDRLIKTIENCSSQQTNVMKEELQLVREKFNGDFTRLMNCLQKVDASILDIKNSSSASFKDISSLIDDLKKQNESLSLNIQDSSTSASANMLKLLKTESDIINRCDSMKNELVDCFNKNTEMIISSDKNCKENVIKTLNKIDDIINAIKDISVQLSGAKDDLNGILSNIQTSFESTYQIAEEVKNLNEESRGFIEDVNNTLTEIKSEIPNNVNQISDKIGEGIGKQMDDITNREESILNKYDEVLKRINDEIVVKLISDSNNLLTCMRDCYKLLEIIRRTKK